MDSYEQFAAAVQKQATAFQSTDPAKPIRLISHLDADGISAAALMVKLMTLENRQYSLTIVPQLKKETLEQLAQEDYQYYIFSDLGSGTLSDIEQLFVDKQVFILDHHEPEKLKTDRTNIHFLNPHTYDVDGGVEVSGSGVAFLFAKAVNQDMDNFAHVALIGAIGDMQEKDGFAKINKEILNTAVEKNKIKVLKGLRMFGAQTKPLHKILEYSSDPKIPGVSGSESGALQFLMSLGIDPKLGSGWKKVRHLTEEEMQRLIAGVIMQRADEENPDDVLGNVYILKEEQNDDPTRDLKEFATLLNACGRLDKASLGIGACLGDPKIKKKAISLMSAYKREIVASLRWYNDNKESSDFIHRGDGFSIVNAQDKVRPTIIGTMTSIVTKGNNCTDRFMLSMAQTADGTTKISLRKPDAVTGFDLKEIMVEICEGLHGAEAGGHTNAAGAIIPTDIEDQFVDRAKTVLGQKALEESVVS